MYHVMRKRSESEMGRGVDPLEKIRGFSDVKDAVKHCLESNGAMLRDYGVFDVRPRCWEWVDTVRFSKTATGHKCEVIKRTKGPFVPLTNLSDLEPR